MNLALRNGLHKIGYALTAELRDSNLYIYLFTDFCIPKTKMYKRNIIQYKIFKYNTILYTTINLIGHC